MRCFITNVCSCRMSTQRNILCLMALVLSGAMEFANACTSAIISGKVTPDGRPIMWKNRDAENLKNCVRSHLSRSFHNPLMGIDLKDGNIISQRLPVGLRSRILSLVEVPLALWLFKVYGRTRMLRSLRCGRLSVTHGYSCGSGLVERRR